MFFTKEVNTQPIITKNYFIVLIIILIKSNIVLFSLFSLTPVILEYNIYALFPALFLISFSLIFSPKGELIYLFCLDFFISVLFIADMVYGRAYGHLISFYMMFAKDVMGDLGPSAVALAKWTDFLMLADLPVIFILALKSRDKQRIKKRIYLFYLTVIISAIIICFQFVNLESTKMLGNYKLHPLIMSPIGNHMFDLYRFAYEKGDTLDKKDIETIDAWLEINKKYQYPDENYTNLEGIGRGKNIIVVQFESLENIMVGKSYYGQEITPNINKLLKNSIYFSNMVEQVRDGNSSDAELLFNTSVLPLKNGSAFLRFGENKYITLPKLLHDKGYVSVAIHGDDKEFWNRDCVFPALGFDKYIDEQKFDDKSAAGMGISDKSLFNQTIKEIKKLKEPYNIFVITLTSHTPFALDKKDQFLNLPDDDVSSLYLQSIHYTDKFLGEFYSQLVSEGILDNAVLVLYGDHEGIHKYYKTDLPDNNDEVPFIIHMPGMKGFEIDKAGGQVDMMPTLAYLMGIEKEKFTSGMMGRNLFGKYSGSGIFPTGEALKGIDDIDHLEAAIDIADKYIRGDYLKTKASNIAPSEADK